MKERYENNQMIAKFMGEEVVEHQKHSLCIYRGEGDDKCEIITHYDISWNWLMPVVEKILKTKLDKHVRQTFKTFGMVDNKTGDFMVRFNGFFLHIDNDLIKATYKAVIEYIEHYNSIK